MPKAKSLQEKKPNYHLQLVKKFVNIEFCCDKGFWPREMKIAGSLLKKYDLNFLLWVQPPETYKVTSMKFFISPVGKDYLSQQFFTYSKNKTDLSSPIINTVLSPTKIGQDAIINQNKPRSLRDFINMQI